ncbi:hypothetical protein [Candidatus Magnetaquiglobus chichijimensis]|uniref:hypothetical protein n=1 Tax=Candidatus Magnetaquiglobus chichijimensis TaxID=3141448 RepID=UPI003B97688F
MKITISGQKYRLDKTAGSYGIGVIKRRHSGEVLDGITMQAIHAAGGRIETDAPGKVLAALGVPPEIGMEWIRYSSPERDELLKIRDDHQITNREIGEMLDIRTGTVDGWTCDPWSRRHSPIPPGMLALLKERLEKK